MPKQIMSAIQMSVLDSALINAVTFTPFYATGLPKSCSIIRIVNDSTVSCEISYNGIGENDYVRADSDLEVQAQTNNTRSTERCNFEKGAMISVRGTPGTGSITLAGYYQE